MRVNGIDNAWSYDSRSNSWSYDHRLASALLPDSADSTLTIRGMVRSVHFRYLLALVIVAIVTSVVTMDYASTHDAPGTVTIRCEATNNFGDDSDSLPLC